MSLPTFKEQVAADNVNIFMNFYEFAEMHNVGGTDMLCIVDDNELIDRAKRYQYRKSLYADGVFLTEVMIYVKASDFGNLPAIGRSLKFDNKVYLISDAVDEDGIYSITLEANKTS